MWSKELLTELKFRMWSLLSRLIRCSFITCRSAKGIFLLEFLNFQKQLLASIDGTFCGFGLVCFFLFLFSQIVLILYFFLQRSCFLCLELQLNSIITKPWLMSSILCNIISLCLVKFRITSFFYFCTIILIHKEIIKRWLSIRLFPCYFDLIALLIFR